MYVPLTRISGVTVLRPIDQLIVTGVLVPSAQRPLLEVTLAVYVPAFVPTLPVMSIVALSKPVTVTVCAEPLYVYVPVMPSVGFAGCDVGISSQIAYSVTLSVMVIASPAAVAVPPAEVAQPTNLLPSGAVKPFAGSV